MVRRPPPETPPADTIVRSLRSRDPAVRRAALSRAASGSRIEPAERARLGDVAAGALRDDDAGVRVAAIRAIIRLRPANGFQALVRAAGEDPAPEVRREAIAALARLIPPSAPG